jgi:hypothetical protein
MSEDNLFESLLEHAQEELKKSGKELDFEQLFKYALKQLIEIMQSNEEKNIKKLNDEYGAFNKRNYLRWKTGFQKLEMLRQISIDAGMEFQKQFLKYPEYKSDPLLGVLMRQHANACRITGEIIHLLKGGYADAALARWRSLFEIVVTCLVLNKHGKEAAVDYIKHGKLKSIEGIEEYQKTAVEMNVKPYSKEEIEQAIALKELLLGNEKSYHWATKYTKYGKLEKLREYVGLSKWSHNYMLASKYIHANYSEMLSLFAMSECNQDLLLIGQSNSGMTGPAHMTAISLSQITTIFLKTYINDKNTKLDYINATFFISLLKQYTDDVGNEFLKCSQQS